MTAVRRPTERTQEEKRLLDLIKQSDPDFCSSIELVERFTVLVRNRNEVELESWRTQAEETPVLRSFAQGVRRDEAAVRAGLSLPWSNGPVMGAVKLRRMARRSIRRCLPLPKSKLERPPQGFVFLTHRPMVWRPFQVR